MCGIHYEHIKLVYKIGPSYVSIPTSYRTIRYILGVKIVAFFDKTRKRKRLEKLLLNGKGLTSDEKKLFVELTGTDPNDFFLDHLMNSQFDAIVNAERHYKIKGLVFRRDMDGFYYFSNKFLTNNAERYCLTDWEWNGPMYKTTATTVGSSVSESQTNGRLSGGMSGFGLGKSVNGVNFSLMSGQLSGEIGMNTKTQGHSKSVTSTHLNEMYVPCVLKFISLTTGKTRYESVPCTSDDMKLIWGLDYTEDAFMPKQQEKYAEIQRRIAMAVSDSDDELLNEIKALINKQPEMSKRVTLVTLLMLNYRVYDFDKIKRIIYRLGMQGLVSDIFSDDIRQEAVESNSAVEPQQEEGDPLLHEAVKLAIETGSISTSTVQRRLSVGYARAARIIDQLEQSGIISSANGSKPRGVLVSHADMIGALGGKQEDIDDEEK